MTSFDLRISFRCVLRLFVYRNTFCTHGYARRIDNHPAILEAMKLKKVHHVAIIASDYEKSKKFYTEILGLRPLNETYRKDRKSYMLDLALNDDYIIELFSFPDPPKRPTYPEATGLRHLAFAVDDVEAALQELKEKGIKTTALQIDTKTGKPMAFFFDPDELPLELSEA